MSGEMGIKKSRDQILLRSLLGLLVAMARVTTVGAAGFEYEKQPSFIKHNQCIRAYEHACFGFVSKTATKLRATPNETSEVLGTVRLGDGIAVLEPFESFEHPGWVMVMATRVRGTDRAEIAWIQRSGVLFRWEFQRVVGCWPVAALSWTEEGAGDYDGGVFEPQFDLKGNIGGANAHARRFFESYAVYYAGGVFVIYDTTKQARLSPTFTLDWAKRRVTNSYLSIQKTKTGNPPYRLVNDEALKGCAQIPTVDPSHPLLSKPTPK